MTDPREPSPSIDAEVREHRIYYEVERETAQHGAERATVALRVVLWATIPKDAGSLPGQPGCRAAVAALEATATEAIVRADVDPAPDAEPFLWALYESRQEPGADEVKLVVNVRSGPGEEGPDDAARERSLQRLRQVLEALGVFEGHWRRRTVETRSLPATAGASVGARTPGGVRAARGDEREGTQGAARTPDGAREPLHA